MKKIIILTFFSLFNPLLSAEVDSEVDQTQTLDAYDRRVGNLEEKLSHAESLQQQLDSSELDFKRRQELSDRLVLTLQNADEIHKSLEKIEDLLNPSLSEAEEDEEESEENEEEAGDTDLDSLVVVEPEMGYTEESEEPKESYFVTIPTTPQERELKEQRAEFDAALSRISDSVNDMALDQRLEAMPDEIEETMDPEEPVVLSTGSAYASESWAVNNNGQTAAAKREVVAHKPIDENQWKYAESQYAQTPDGQEFTTTTTGTVDDSY